MNKPSWEQIIQLLRDDDPRNFRIDIETEATAQSEVQRDKQDVVELLTAIGQLWQAGANGMQSGMIDKKQVDALTLAMVRKFDLGRQIEDVLDPDGNKQVVEPDAEKQQLQQQLQQMQQVVQQLQQQLEDKRMDMQLKDKTSTEKIASNEKMNTERLKVQQDKINKDFVIDQQQIEQGEDELQLEVDKAGIEAIQRIEENKEKGVDSSTK